MGRELLSDHRWVDYWQNTSGMGEPGNKTYRENLVVWPEKELKQNSTEQQKQTTRMPPKKTHKKQNQNPRQRPKLWHCRSFTWSAADY